MGKKPSKIAATKPRKPRAQKTPASKPRAKKVTSTQMTLMPMKKQVTKTSPKAKREISVLLAETWREGIDPTGYFMSEKLDGVRAYWDAKKQKLFTRDGNELKAPEWFTKGFPSFDLDGELFGGRGNFQQTVGIVKRYEEDEGWKIIYYVIFDAPTINGDFIARNNHLIQWYDKKMSPRIVLLAQTQCKNRTHLDKTLEDICAVGGEGVMLRMPTSAYERKRSSTLLKVKRVKDAEAKVIGYTKGTGKYVGMVGALEMEMPNGKHFKIGSGLTDDDRARPPPIGAIVSYGYQELSNEGNPRFPRFLRVRKDVTWAQILKQQKGQ